MWEKTATYLFVILNKNDIKPIYRYVDHVLLPIHSPNGLTPANAHDAYTVKGPV